MNLIFRWKVLLFFTISFLSSFYVYSQSHFLVETKYKQAGLVWGLLKYHHPEISKGKLDWDGVFIEMIEQLNTVNSQKEMNHFLLNFISKYETKKIKSKQVESENLFTENVDYHWIESAVFGEELTEILMKYKENINLGNYYVSMDKLTKMLSFDNEKGLKDFDYTIKNHRLLLLFSFWNAMEYWNVNKYLMDTKWSVILDLYVPEFIESSTLLEFEVLKSKLIASLDDSHSFYLSSVVHDSLFRYKPVFSVRAINDSLKISAVYNKSLAQKDGIELGDIITHIENKDILTSLEERIEPILSVSNPSFLRRWSTWALYNDKEFIEVDILKKDGRKINKTIQLYQDFKDEEPSYLEALPDKKWSFVAPDIAYIHLGQITKKELSKAFKEVSESKGLILDLRNYPRYFSIKDITKFLYPKKEEFVKVLFPIKNAPSYGEYAGNALLNRIANPFKSGKTNKNYFKGKVILLVNNRTQSQAEYIGMAIQQSPNCYTIGTQTAGSVMNIASFIMSDKTEVNFTGLGAFYPDDKGVQRTGLHIDYPIKESAKKYDNALFIEKAILLINNES